MKRDAAPRYPLGGALDFLERTWRVNHAMQRVSNRMARDLGLTGPQRLVVRCVGKYPGLTASQLASLLHLDRGTVSAALNRLDGKGLVERRADPRDGRRVTLGLTAEGRALDRPTEHTIEATVESLLERLSDADRETTMRVLAMLAQALELEADREP
ncbi:MAG: Organic hydroperoxide resistance transcriptional regulator [Deltaproteobacteria bacterium]|nr:Organic hydroperoxide resistance transcriptional regulator [Deltaproteobacteria bacterium]